MLCKTRRNFKLDDLFIIVILTDKIKLALACDYFGILMGVLKLL